MVEDLPKFIDKATFNQILDMDDDDEDRDFSKDIVSGYFKQVEQTLKEMRSSMYEYMPPCLQHLLSDFYTDVFLIRTEESPKTLNSCLR